MGGLKGNICVFTGSRRGAGPDYVSAARQFGRELTERGYGLVYGGGNVGLMTVVADTVLEYHGYVTGVIPETLVEKEVVHRGLSDLRIVGSMHERKATDGGTLRRLCCVTGRHWHNGRVFRSLKLGAAGHP